MAAGKSLCENSQDAEGNVDVLVVVPVVVHVRQSTVLGVASDEPVLGTVGEKAEKRTTASRFATAHHVRQTFTAG